MAYPATAPVYGILNTKVLILNRSYLPIHVTSVRRAFVLLYQGIARAVNEQYQTFDFDSWSELSISAHDETIGLVNRVIRIPRVILLVTYDRVPKRQVRFSRYNIYARDKCTCLYCGRRLPRHGRLARAKPERRWRVGRNVVPSAVRDDRNVKTKIVAR